MFVIVERVMDKNQSDLPDKDLANVVHGEYTLLEAVNEAERMYQGHHQNLIYIQEISKELKPKSSKKYKVVYMMVNNYQSIAVYLLEEESSKEVLKDGVEINGEHIAFYGKGKRVAELKASMDRDFSEKTIEEYIEKDVAHD